MHADNAAVSNTNTPLRALKMSELEANIFIVTFSPHVTAMAAKQHLRMMHLVHSVPRRLAA